MIELLAMSHLQPHPNPHCIKELMGLVAISWVSALDSVSSLGVAVVFGHYVPSWSMFCYVGTL
jgi:hypothetical protein